jgi:hypothetical protein
VKPHASLWFKAAAVAGAGIAVLLLADTVFAYRYVTARFARDQGLLQAVEEVASLEHELRRQQVDGVDGLLRVLREIHEDRTDEIAWMRVLRTDGQAEAASGAVEPHALPPADRIRAVMDRKERYSTVQHTSRGEVLITLLPMKQRIQQPGMPGDERLAEVGIYLQATEGILHPLGRSLLINTLAAISLLASMLVFFIRLPSYVRGRTLESQVQLARIVQQRLLPENNGGGIEFSAECVPADQVGGDFYDVFQTAAGETVVVLADVSGKGLPAALRMGIVHGAVRALSLGKRKSDIAQMTERLNELLREGGSAEFVTLFWAFYNPEMRTLRYVNAGHLPPLLVGSASGDLRRLETGGTVLGLLPNVTYQEECINLDGDEALIAYSDGLLEATNPADEEFGESRVLPLVRASAGRSPQEVLRLVLQAANQFVRDGEFQDDLTVLVARLAGSRWTRIPILPAPDPEEVDRR